MSSSRKVPDFKAMAELRYQIRKFIRFSENAARSAGIEPQQHQLLLAVRGLPDGAKPTIGVLAERMQLQHHSTVELIDRLVDRGLLCRLRATGNRTGGIVAHEFGCGRVRAGWRGLLLRPLRLPVGVTPGVPRLPLAHAPVPGVVSAAHRPQEAVVNHVVEALNRQARVVAAGPVTGLPVGFTVCTGDNIDNAQLNELTWFTTLMNGGTITPNSGAPDTGSVRGQRVRRRVTPTLARRRASGSIQPVETRWRALPGAWR